ncbi:MAG: hypothetical protein QME55_00940, partial [Brevundimonas sp.]|nr:hypothetical protein [Brevundimonas sp.]
MVARARGQAPAWLMMGIIVLGGVMLFVVLDGQRRAATAPTTQVRVVDGVYARSALPPLYIAPVPPPPPPPPAELGPEPAPA